MSIFGKIMSSIFGKAQASGVSSDKAAPGAKPSSSAAATATAGSIRNVDVAGVLTKLAAEKSEKLDWQKSIIDLMKLLDLDSSLSARKELAQELQYSGDTNDSASMNVWLHKQVMRKLAENGGKVPEELQVGAHAGSTDINSSNRNEEQTTSVFGKIMSSIFGKANAAGAAPAPGAKPSSATQGSAPAGSITEVDVAGILTKLVADKKEKLDWQKSIIDLMKLLDLDSSLSARKELAQELQFSGDMNDSASMNIWLHKQVMRKLAENGGKVPEELKA
jgi:hypothetical protein